jgi:proline dehydrogenase
MEREAEVRTRELAEAVWTARPSPWRRPLTELSRRLLGRLDDRPALRSALFRFVDVAPACTGPRDRSAHMRALLREVEGERIPLLLRPLAAERGAPLLPYGLVSRPVTALVARQFIAGGSAARASRTLRRMWRGGHAFSLDLLGEATVTAAEAASYADRCETALRELAEATRSWPERPLLDRDRHGPLPRANLSIKLTALTPLVRPLSPSRGAADSVLRLRPLLAAARDLGAHVHVDMEDCDSREMVVRALEQALEPAEFRAGPSVGLVLQAYLRDSGELLERILDSEALMGREVPLTVRLVKGAYWDREQVVAAQRGWEPPVWNEKPESDLSFERLSERLIDAGDRIRPALATHNLRSMAHALAYNEAAGGGSGDVEIQVLHGLGDELADALAKLGYRVRVYTPIGDLVAGMAYLVRRLLENSSGQGFLLQQRHRSLDELLELPA